MKKMDNFASIIRQRRDELALNQEQVAQRSGVSVSAYTKYENGRNEPTWSKALAILAALGLEVRLGGVPVQSVSEREAGGADAGGDTGTIGYVTIAINGHGFDRWRVIREPGVSDVTVDLNVNANLQGQPVEESS